MEKLEQELNDLNEKEIIEQQVKLIIMHFYNRFTESSLYEIEQYTVGHEKFENERYCFIKELCHTCIPTPQQNALYREAVTYSYLYKLSTAKRSPF